MDKFFIGPFTSGIKKDVVPFLAPEDAFTELTNMMVYKNSVTRTYNHKYLSINSLKSRLRIDIGLTDAVTGNISVIIPSALGFQFSIGDAIFTIYRDGDMHSTSVATGTYNIGTGAVDILNADVATICYCYPCRKVINFSLYKGLVNTVEIAFDERVAYKYTDSGWEALTTDSAKTWIGSTSMSTENFLGATAAFPLLIMAASVYNTPSGQIRYYDGTNVTNWYPAFSAAANNNVRACKTVKSFSGRLFLLNTIEYEGATVEIKHQNRARYSAYQDIILVDAWYQSPLHTNKGDYIDLPIGEVITGCEILGNRLIVFCEKSIWSIIDTGNSRDPFQVSMISDNIGSPGGSIAEVNNQLIFVNSIGIHATDGNNITRISDDIIFEQRYYDTRLSFIYNDVEHKLLYISLLESNSLKTSKMLIFNYENNTWSILLHQYTAMGQLWHNAAGVKYAKQYAVTGNYYGYTHIYDKREAHLNSGWQSIIDVIRLSANELNLSIPAHNLDINDIIEIEGCTIPNLNSVYTVMLKTPDGVKIINNLFNAVLYNGSATYSIVDSIKIQTKQFNFYLQEGKRTVLNKIDFNVNKTECNGEYAVNLLPSGSSIIEEEAYMGVLETKAYTAEEALQTNKWFSVYISTMAESISFIIAFTPDQLANSVIPYQDLTINAMIIYADRAG